MSQSKTTQREVLQIVVSVWLLLGTAAIATGAVLRLNNTLQRYPMWEDQKASVETIAWGEREFLQTRTALARDELNLGAWLGYHEIYYRELVSLEEISYHFKLTPGSYLVFLFKGEDGSQLD